MTLYVTQGNVSRNLQVTRPRLRPTLRRSNTYLMVTAIFSFI